MKLDWKKCMGLVFLLLLIVGCADVDEDTDCTYHLNQENYDKVSTDSTCSTYERASAYLGLAGFRFSNFLAGDASNNFRTALGIPDSVTSWSSWSGKTYYENAMKLTGDSTGDTYEGQTRNKADVEIHYFAAVGALTALTYIEMDSNSDGKVAESEIQAFTGIRVSSDASYGKNQIAPAEWFEFVTDKGTGSEKVYLLNSTSGQCIPNTVAPKYDGLWNGTTYSISAAGCGVVPTPSVAQIAQWTAAGSGSLAITGYCSAVVKVEELQNITTTSSGSMSVLDLTQAFVTYVSKIDRDLQALGIDADSDLRKGLSEFSTKIDNGATCTKDTLTEVEQIFTILNVAAENAATDYENVNVLSLSDVSSASDTVVVSPSFSTVVTVTPPTVPVTISFSCTNSSNLAARLIYSDGASGYVPNYSSASTAIKNTFTSLNNLNKDASGKVKPTQKGDTIVSFKELICME